MTGRSGHPEAQLRGSGETILVVEDEPVLRDLAQLILQDCGYRVLAGGFGRGGADSVAGNQGAIDLLLTDVVMPDGLSGKDLAESLMGHKPELKVIFTSGYSLAVVGVDLVLREGLNFLQKPYNPRKLAQAVRDCLDG